MAIDTNAGKLLIQRSECCAFCQAASNWSKSHQSESLSVLFTVVVDKRHERIFASLSRASRLRKHRSASWRILMCLALPAIGIGIGIVLILYGSFANAQGCYLISDKGKAKAVST